MMSVRPGLVQIYLEIAAIWARRATCAKRQVGAVIVDRDGHQLSSGYNGQPSGDLHCTIESPCPAFNDTSLSCNAIHAEINALINCSDIRRAHTIYITTKPCDKCMLSIRNSPIENVIYLNEAGNYHLEIIK